MFNKHMGLKLDIFKYINEKLLFLIKIIKRNLHLARVSYGIKKLPFYFSLENEIIARIIDQSNFLWQNISKIEIDLDYLILLILRYYKDVFCGY